MKGGMMANPIETQLLSNHTTLHVGGPAKRFVFARDAEEIITLVRDAAAQQEPVLMLGSGANLLVADTGFDGLVIKDSRSNMEIVQEEGECAWLRADGGLTWDDLVDGSIELGLAGLEALYGIPGTVGASPIQNIGAYGHEVAEFIDSITVLDTQTGEVSNQPYKNFNPQYRTSDLKKQSGRYVVLDVIYRLTRSKLSAPLMYRQLIEVLNVHEGARLDAQEVRNTVHDIRKSKGMMYDESDHDTWSAGSFFTNPIISKKVSDDLDSNVPRYPLADKDRVKVSAAWLIEHAGFPKGFSVPGGSGRAALSSRHTLALTNRGGATAEEIVELARYIRNGVATRYGIELEPEPVQVGVRI